MRISDWSSDVCSSDLERLTRLKDEAVGHFASGWAWLVLRNGKLEVTSYHDADTPIAHEGVAPLLTLDVWEHAYYIDYRNARPKFAETVLANLINWDFVAQNLDGQGAARAAPRQSQGHSVIPFIKRGGQHYSGAIPKSTAIPQNR